MGLKNIPLSPQWDISLDQNAQGKLTLRVGNQEHEVVVRQISTEVNPFTGQVHTTIELVGYPQQPLAFLMRPDAVYSERDLF